MDYIENISERKAYLVLMALCEENSTIRNKAEKLMDQIDDSEEESNKRKAEDNDDDEDEDWMSCTDCKKNFTLETSRGSFICRFHKSALEPDSEKKWPCCDREAASKGCRKRNHHVSDEASSKRAKVEGDGDESEDVSDNEESTIKKT